MAASEDWTAVLKFRISGEQKNLFGDGEQQRLALKFKFRFHFDVVLLAGMAFWVRSVRCCPAIPIFYLQYFCAVHY